MNFTSVMTSFSFGCKTFKLSHSSITVTTPSESPTATNFPYKAAYPFSYELKFIFKQVNAQSETL
jgi:hypothetical protein